MKRLTFLITLIITISSVAAESGKAPNVSTDLIQKIATHRHDKFQDEVRNYNKKISTPKALLNQIQDQRSRELLQKMIQRQKIRRLVKPKIKGDKLVFRSGKNQISFDFMVLDTKRIMVNNTPVHFSPTLLRKWDYTHLTQFLGDVKKAIKKGKTSSTKVLLDHIVMLFISNAYADEAVEFGDESVILLSSMTFLDGLATGWFSADPEEVDKNVPKLEAYLDESLKQCEDNVHKPYSSSDEHKIKSLLEAAKEIERKSGEKYEKSVETAYKAFGLEEGNISCFMLTTQMNKSQLEDLREQLQELEEDLQENIQEKHELIDEGVAEAGGMSQFLSEYRNRRVKGIVDGVYDEKIKNIDELKNSVTGTITANFEKRKSPPGLNILRARIAELEKKQSDLCEKVDRVNLCLGTYAKMEEVFANDYMRGTGTVSSDGDRQLKRIRKSYRSKAGSK